MDSGGLARRTHWHIGEYDAGQLCSRKPDADAIDKEGGHEAPRVRVGLNEQGEGANADRLECHAELHNATRTESLRDGRGGTTGDEGTDGEARDQQARLGGAEPEHALEIERNRKQHAELSEADEQRRDVAEAERAQFEQFEVDEAWLASTEAIARVEEKHDDADKRQRDREGNR